MEIFNFEDWRAEGRRRARAKGSPNEDTETFSLETDGSEVYVYYNVELKSTHFKTLVERMTVTQFSTRFFSMLEVEEGT